MLRTATRLATMGHKVDIFTMSWDGEAPVANIQVHILPATGWFNYQKYQNFIDQAFNQIEHDFNFDLIVGYNRMRGLDVYFAADPCFIERAFKQRSWIYRLTPRYRWFQKAEKAIFSPANSTEILMVDMNEKAVFQRWYQTQDERFHFIPPFLSPERFSSYNRLEMRAYLRQTFALNQEDVVVLLVGSGFYMKGLDRAISAIASLPDSVRQRVKLVAIGQDKPAPFIKLADKLGVSENLVISKGRPDIPKLMQGADLYLHPAYRENTGLVLLEALACGLPVMATASCGYAYHIQNAEAGRIVPIPFVQNTLNQMLADLLSLVLTADPILEVWHQNGLAYAKGLMAANDGSAEANILLKLAQSRQEEINER